MASKENTQEKIILQHCIEHGRISHVEAMTLYGVESLSSQIARLRKKGYEFTKKEITATKEGKKYHNVVFTLVNHINKENKEGTVIIEVPKELKSVVIIPFINDNTKHIKVFKNDKGVYEYKENG